MSDRQRKIYQSEGERYEALISREDHQGNIPRVIDEIINVDGLDVIDLGAGTGRLTLILAPRAKSIRAFDASAEMLRVCRERLIASGPENWQVDVAAGRGSFGGPGGLRLERKLSCSLESGTTKSGVG